MLTRKTLLPILTIIVFIGLFTNAFGAEATLQNKDVPRLTIQELERLQKSEPVTIIDTRRPDQWEQATDKIPGAIRITTYDQIYDLQKKIKVDSAIVTYCT